MLSTPIEREATNHSLFIVTWQTRTELVWQLLVMTVNRGPWSRAMKVQEAMCVIFITQEPAWQGMINCLVLWTSLHIVSSLSSTNVITLPSSGWVTQIHGGSHVTTLTWHTGEGPLLRISTSALAGWTTHVQTAAVDVTAIRMIKCGVRTAVSLLKSLTFQFYSWDLEIQALHVNMVTTRLGNSSATEVNSVLQSVLNAFVLAQNARGKSFEESIRTISSGSTNHKFLVVVVSN